MLGQLMAEYSSEVGAQNGTQYLTADHLGTPRVITGADAAVKARHDYLPYGEEIGADVGGRTGKGYSSSDNTRQEFAGSEHDGETGLDYMKARYYASKHGRFTSVDPENAGADLSDPQSWNGYAYVGNNPLAFIDPTGLGKWVTIGDQQYFVGEEGEYNKDLNADWVVDESRPGGYWNFRPTVQAGPRAVYDPMVALEWRIKNWPTEKWVENFEKNDRERRERNQDRLRSILGSNSGDIVMTFIPAPRFLRAFPFAKLAKRKTPIKGGGGLRKRWKDSSGNIYEWDYQHGRVEKFDKRGKHLGEFDADTGAQTKPPNSRKNVEP